MPASADFYINSIINGVTPGHVWDEDAEQLALALLTGETDTAGMVTYSSLTRASL